jgi:hypothetical protein
MFCLFDKEILAIGDAVVGCGRCANLHISFGTASVILMSSFPSFSIRALVALFVGAQCSHL